MKRRLTILVLTALAMAAIFGAVSTFTSPSDAVADNETFTYQWFAAAPADDFCGGFPPCPDEATASNGDTIEIRGFGTLQVHPKEATGGGTFVHRDANGNLLGEGDFSVVELLNFKSYGPGDLSQLPAGAENWRAGLARMRVDLFVGTTQVGEAVLTVGCILPGVKIPGGDKQGAGLFEGATLNVLGGLNFNKPTEPRITLFVATSNNAP